MVGTRQQFTKPVIVVFDNVAKEIAAAVFHIIDDLEMTEKDSDAFIESVFDSLYKKCHPISLNVVFPKAAAQNDRAL